jgi:dihydroxyacetone kinase-like protein
VSNLLRGACTTMTTRGKASLGDKTVLDVLDAAAHATEGLDEPQAILQSALKATQETMDRLRSKPAQVGRARIFGDRSIGLDDPGMAAFRTILQGLAAG